MAESELAKTKHLSICAAGTPLDFQRVKLTFLGKGIGNVFAFKNNKTVRETLSHHRYAKFTKLIEQEYSESMEVPLGTFLIGLKLAGDPTYRRFLNSYGDETYCRFRMERSPLSAKKGMYCYCIDTQPVYFGRSFDPFEKRINQGYGTIHPKNCYLDGQATNCHLNALVAANLALVSFFVCPMADNTEIEHLARLFIRTLKPLWNIALK